MSKLRILQIGAGSMGIRRLRDLALRDDVTLAVFDSRADRRIDAAARFRIPTFTTLDDALAWQPQALCISTPPDQHSALVHLAVDHSLHHFCEANIWTADWQKIERISQERRLISAPSCSFHFHPLVASLKRMVRESLGRLHSWQFCLSTYMPDWHPEEGEEYYARQRSTAAAREMVPFELLWLNEVFGDPVAITGAVRQYTSLGQVQEDSWSLQIEMECGAIGQMSVHMGCPSSRRHGLCVGDQGFIEFDIWHGLITHELNNCVHPITNSFGCQSELIETIYKQEIHTFLDAIRGAVVWPLSYRNACDATATLAAAEVSSLFGRKQKVHSDCQPAFVPTDYPDATHRFDRAEGHHQTGKRELEKPFLKTARDTDAR